VIHFYASVRSAHTKSDDAITTSSVGIPVTLILASEFDGLAKTAVFKAGSVLVDIALVGDATETEVPVDVLATSGKYLEMGIYAADGNGTIVIPTVWATVGMILPGTIPSGVDPSATTPSWVAQVQNIASQASEEASDALTIAQGVKAQADAGDFDGTDGVSPTVSVSDITGGHRVVITDANGSHTFDVMDGVDGTDGTDGTDGYSPTVSITDITGGHRVTITDVNGSHSFDVMDGTGGQGSDDVFVATYGTTTNAEIETALSAGQTVFCKLTNSGVDYYLPLTRRYSATDHRFAAQYSATDIYAIGCSCISNAWNSWNRRIMPMPSSPSSGDVLAYNGSAWAGKALTASDVGALPDTTTIPSAATATPSDLGTAAVGTSSKYAKEDHVHNKPTYSKSDVGLGNVDNVQQYSANNPPPYPVSSVNGQTGAVSLSIPSSASDVGAVAVAQGVGHAGEFLVVGSNGDVTTVTLSTWQGGSY
jgi:hypothetical protein